MNHSSPPHDPNRARVAASSPLRSEPAADHSRGAAVIPFHTARAPMAPTVIAVTSGKGGVGKTNVAVNLAIALRRRGARVLCIDADLGLANMDIVMGVAPTYTAAELVRGEVDIDDVLVEGPEGVVLLPGASGQYDIANLDDHQRHGLFAAVDTLDDRFDVVVVDTGAGVGSNAVGFAAAAKEILVVVTPEPTSVADAYGMVKVLSTRCAVRRLGILTTMVGSNGEGEQVFRRLNSLADRFLNVALDHVGSIPRDPTIGRSVMRGEPVVCAFPDAPASRAFEQIAQRVAEQGGGDDRQGAIRLFWRKLLRRSSTGRGEVAL